MYRNLKEDQHRDKKEIFTDGSRETSNNGVCKVSAGMVIPSLDVKEGWKLPQYFSVFSAEMYGLYRALIFIEGHPIDKYVICTDSLSALSAMKSRDKAKSNSLLWEVLRKFHLLTIRGHEISFEWVPGHKGVVGNELADQTAREACGLAYITIPGANKQDMNSRNKNAIYSYWGVFWEQRCSETRVGRALRLIRQDVGPWPWSFIPEHRALETAFARLRIGHCGLRANRHRFAESISPFCECGEPETIMHALMDCPRFSAQRASLQGKMSGLEWSLKSLLGGSKATMGEQILTRTWVSEFLSTTGLLGRV